MRKFMLLIVCLLLAGCASAPPPCEQKPSLSISGSGFGSGASGERAAFAAAALQGLLASGADGDLVKVAYSIADAMIKGKKGTRE